MKSGIKFMAVAATLLLLTAGSQGAFANCTNFGAGFPVFQCGFVGWFAPTPASAGTVTATWWQISYGNRTVANGVGGTALEGTGNSALGTFAGNDNGNFSIVMTDAAAVLDAYFPGQIPAGALCSNFENSWSQVGNDGCVDNPRDGAADDDNLLNPFFSAILGTQYCNDANYNNTVYGYNLYRQMDYPMAMMLQESTGKYFALACAANASRGSDTVTRCNDTSDGYFNFGTIVNGDLNPTTTGPAVGLNNIIPWQQVPVPKVDSVVIAAPGGVTGDRMLSLSWNNVAIQHDGTVRPTAKASMIRGGVGCLDMGALVRFVLETAPLLTSDPNPSPSSLTWTAAQTIPAPVNPTDPVLASITVPPDTAVRVRTILGVNPRTTASGVAGCRLGSCGDRGFEAGNPNTSPILIIGGALASQKVVDLDASTSKGTVHVTFRTTSETSVDSISILTVGKGGETVARTLTPQQGTTGVGASYAVELSMSDLKGAKQIAVRLDGGGSLIDKSAPVSIR